ncbi:Yqey-like protein-domain-containing protein [Thamnocephalis sphaerospora]|uniref:Altered inheritance of mitochondria protein 41 n=1 Tax=Thamnocephalis sphaerospora TaxID=78915 RepID=A0A4P9XS47_9FUNG|nr:Yqey-like protein-domain-containing protein [Thamnocephalis sphaerospora]|eukprot:RKP08351.1 Yqey-like protein-domain-containing protein [Thamnocephalis sphaerospora]
MDRVSYLVRLALSFSLTNLPWPGAHPLLTRLRDDIKQAMRAKDKARTALIRAVVADVTYAEKNATNEQAAAQALEDAGVIVALQRAVKKRREAVDAYVTAGREDLAEKERAEVEVLNTYLPQQWSREAIREEVVRAVAEVGATSVKDMGKVMRVVRVPAGSAPKQTIAEVTKEVLASS